jgi:hypothetical protein
MGKLDRPSAGDDGGKVQIEVVEQNESIERSFLDGVIVLGLLDQ